MALLAGPRLVTNNNFFKKDLLWISPDRTWRRLRYPWGGARDTPWRRWRRMRTCPWGPSPTGSSRGCRYAWGDTLACKPRHRRSSCTPGKIESIAKYCIERESCCSEIISTGQSDGCISRHQPIRGQYCIRGNITAGQGDNSIISFVRVSTIQSK